MTVDRVTEEIAHFIGLFVQAEQPGPRDPDYDPFQILRPAQALDPLNREAPDHRHSYGPEGYDPRVGTESAQDAPAWPGVFWGGLVLPRPDDLAPPALFTPSRSAPDPAPVLPRPGVIEMPPMVDAPPPASYATVTFQSNALADRDVLGTDREAAQAWLGQQDARLMGLVEAATGYMPIDLGGALLPSYPGYADAHALALAATASAEAQGGGGDAAASDPAQRLIVTGADATGTFLNGAASGETGPLPAWGDSLPRLPDLSPIGSLGPSFFRIGDGSVSAITGGNLALNEATLVHQRVDAPVILVGGSVLAWDYVSQINVLQDDGPAGEPGTGSFLQNAAMLTPGTASAPDDALPLLARTGQTPDLIFMTTIEGDLVNYSWTSQWNAADDSDILTLSGGKSWIVTGQNTLVNAEQIVTYGQGYDLILVGGDMISVFAVSQANILLDVDEADGSAAGAPPSEETPAPPPAPPMSQTPSPAQPGGGDPGDGHPASPAASAIPESPVAEAATPKDGATQAQSEAEGGPPPSQEASGGQSQVQAGSTSAPPGDGPAETVQVALAQGKANAGAAVSVTGEASGPPPVQAIPSATAETEDAPDPERAGTSPIPATAGQSTGGAASTAADPATLPATPASEDAPDDDAPLGPGTADNALINSATIAHTALDKIGGLADGLREMIEGLDPQAPDLTALISSPVFAGLETMSVLYVNGDLVNVHAIEQTNIVADGDKLAGAAAEAAIAGANALVNNARLTDIGMDSSVMAGGEVYSDAFLHQAELVLGPEETPPPGGARDAAQGDPVTPLASEAVAFLAEGMQDGHPAFGRFGKDQGDGVASASLGDAGPPADIMQTFLA